MKTLSVYIELFFCICDIAMFMNSCILVIIKNNFNNGMTLMLKTNFIPVSPKSDSRTCASWFYNFRTTRIVKGIYFNFIKMYLIKYCVLIVPYFSVRKLFCTRMGLPTDEDSQDQAGWSKKETSSSGLLLSVSPITKLLLMLAKWG